MKKLSGLMSSPGEAWLRSVTNIYIRGNKCISKDGCRPGVGKMLRETNISPPNWWPEK
jgi:hypothetical protein